MQDAYTEFKNTPAAFKMIFVEGGIFEMGGNDENARQDEKPVHKVKLSSFWMGEIPVTQAVWAWVMKGTDKENPSEFPCNLNLGPRSAHTRAGPSSESLPMVFRLRFCFRSGLPHISAPSNE